MNPITEEYIAHNWVQGEVINQANLNNIEQGLLDVNSAVRSLEVAKVEIETLEAGEQATASYDVASNTWRFALPKGDTGEQGAQGAKGDTGERGLQGEQGPAGVAGPKGDKGESGATGAQGAKGEKGDKGETGGRGNCFRFANNAVNASQGNNPINNLSPTNTDIPVAVNDLVIDNTKKVYKITAISGGNYTASALLGTMA